MIKKRKSDQSGDEDFKPGELFNKDEVEKKAKLKKSAQKSDGKRGRPKKVKDSPVGGDEGNETPVKKEKKQDK